MSTDLMMLSSHLILCCPLLLLPSLFPNIRVFTSESALGIRWPVWELQPHQHHVSTSPFPTVVGSILRVAVLRCSRQPPGWAWGGVQPGQSQQGPCVCVCVCVSVLCVPATPDGLRRKDRGRLSDLNELGLIPAPTAAALPVVLRKGSRCARPPSPQRCGG